MDAFTLERIEFDAIRRITRDYCSCALGKRLAQNMSPSRNPDVIRRWQQQTQEMVRALRDFGPAPFGGIADITDALNRARPGGGADGQDYAAIASNLTGAANVKAYLRKLPEEMTELIGMGQSLETFDELLGAIGRVVAGDGTILDTASPKLGQIRREVEETTRRIHDVIYGYLRNEKVAPLLQSANVTLHGDRYVLPVKAENRGRLPGVVHRSSNTGATVFVEPNASVQLNNDLADLAQDERREIQRLLNDLGVKVQRKHQEIRDTLRTLAKIDLVGAKAQYAYQFEMTRPELSEKNELRIEQARHPLLLDQAHRQEKQGLPCEKRHPVVPIDVRLGSDFDLLIITGSNTGGKTVTLKTVALLAVMTQAGMHIPAQRGATLPVLRDILLDIGDEQSLEHSLSTFGGHVKRIRYILEKTDKDCLVLIDELGAGTDPDEGGAIGQAILDQLRQVGSLGMVTTHLGVLKAYAYNHDRVDNASVEFDVKTLRPTYHLRIGTPGESHAITVAQQLGMPRKITSTAKEYIKSRGEQFKRAIRSTTKARESAEQARTDARLAELAAANQADLYESKLADLNRLQGEFTTWLAQLPHLEPGDAVPVPSLRKTGRLVRLELHKQKALVDCDGVQVEVPIRDLMPSLGQNEVRKQIAELRNRILEQSRQTQENQAEAEKLQQEYRESLRMQKQSARQFDNWLGAIARLKVGDEVPMALKPGKGKVVAVDLPGLKATVRTSAGEKSVGLQDLFPQTGPFARRTPTSEQARKRAKRPQLSGGATKNKAASKPKPDRPMRRRDESSRAARKNRKAMENVQPGDQVFVIPFNKKATLLRLDADKQQAVVLSGAFEMNLPLADVEPIQN